MPRLFSAALLFTAAFAMASGCGGGSPSVEATPYTLPSSSPPVSLSHMYVQYGSDVVEYALPLTPLSVPDALVTNVAIAYAVNPLNGQLAVAQGSGVAIYNAPLSTNKAPAFTIPYNNASTPQTSSMALAFDFLGNLWVCSDALREFAAPLSAQEVSSVANTGLPIPNPQPGSTGYFCFAFMEFAQNETLYGSLPTYFVPAQAVLSFAQSLAPPYSTPPTAINSPFQLGAAPLAFDANGNAVTPYQTIAITTGTPTPSPVPSSVPSSGIGVFSLPVGASALPEAVIPAPTSSANIVADAAEPQAVPTHFYIGNQGDGSIYVYTLPLNAGQSPSVHVPCPTALVTPSNCVLLANQLFQFGP